MMRVREMAQLFSACHQNLIIICLQEVEGDTDTVNLDVRLGQEVGILVLVPHKVGRLAVLLRAVEDRVPDCRHSILNRKEIDTHMRAKQPARKPMMNPHQMAATTEHEE